MRAKTLCALWLVLAPGCETQEVTEPVPVPAPQVPVKLAQPEPDVGPKAKAAATPLPFHLAPRGDTVFVSQSCLQARGPTAADAKANCKDHKRSGSRYERKQCRCEADQILEVRGDAPPAFYVGCCWAVGDTPQQARDACEPRRVEGWCEIEDPDIVHVAIGPYTRKAPFRPFDGHDFSYLVPSDLANTGWIADTGEGPCFPDGTLVELVGGPQPIEAVRPGDEVVTLRDGQRVVVPVLGIKVREADALRLFTFDEGILRLTPNHLVWLDEDWHPASDVEVGDVLQGLDGRRTVRRIDEEHNRVTVRTLSVGAPDSFFAGGVWVHNY